MSAPKSSEIRSSRKGELVGFLAGWLMRCWSKTLRFEIDDRCGITEPDPLLQPVILALWHNRIFTIPPVWAKTAGKFRKAVVLTSASKDGAILSRAMGVFGIGAVRGSSSRRAVAALIGMKRALSEGLDVCITPDGPRGPRYEFQPGIIKVAQTSGAPIVPIHVAYQSAWRLNTWDQMVIPKPFSRVRVVFDEKLVVLPGLDETAFEARRDEIHAILRAGADDA